MRSFSILTLFTLLLAPAIHAQTYQYDDNRDGKIDRIFILENGSIISHQNDRNYDGQWDEIETKKGNVTTTTFDDNFDQKWDKKIQRKTEKSFLIQTTYQIKKGKKELISEIKTPLIQERPCSMNEYIDLLNDIDPFLENLSVVTREIDDSPFYSLMPGLQTHKSCVKRFSKGSIADLMGDAVEKGMSCLEGLANKDRDQSFKSELPNLIDRFKTQFTTDSKPITLTCNDKKRNWDSTVAYAMRTDPSNDRMGPVKAPLVSLNPEYGTSFLGLLINTDMSKNQLSGVLFHEMIHTMGYSHTKDIDLAYACEDCCFLSDKSNKDKGDKDKSLSCKICGGNYQDGVTDEDYLRDLSRFSIDKGYVAAELNFYGNIHDIKANDKNANSLLILMVNKEYSLLQSVYNELSEEGFHIREELWSPSLMSKIKNYQYSDEKIKKYDKLLAQAIVTMFKDKDSDKAAKFLSGIDFQYIERKANARQSEAYDTRRTLDRFLELLSYDSRSYQSVAKFL